MSGTRVRTDRWRLGLAALFTVSGTAHFVAPKPFVSIVPRFLGAGSPWVYASGVAELLCAAGLLSRGHRREAAYASAALLVVIFPANVSMAVDALRTAHSGLYRTIVLARLPLQLPLIAAAVAVARAQEPPRPPQ